MEDDHARELTQPKAPEIFGGHEFEALKCRFENQTEHLYRLTTIDLRAFSGHVSVQLALTAWLATHQKDLAGEAARIGVMVVDLVLASVAGVLLYNNFRRRKEVAGTVRRCNEALGYETEGVYLEGRKLNHPTDFWPWGKVYFVGLAAVAGVAIVLFAT